MKEQWHSSNYPICLFTILYIYYFYFILIFFCLNKWVLQWCKTVYTTFLDRVELRNDVACVAKRSGQRTGLEPQTAGLRGMHVNQLAKGLSHAYTKFLLVRTRVIHWIQAGARRSSLSLFLISWVEVQPVRVGWMVSGCTHHPATWMVCVCVAECTGLWQNVVTWQAGNEIRLRPEFKAVWLVGPRWVGRRRRLFRPPAADGPKTDKKLNSTADVSLESKWSVSCRKKRQGRCCFPFLWSHYPKAGQTAELTY